METLRKKLKHINLLKEVVNVAKQNKDTYLVSLWNERERLNISVLNFFDVTIFELWDCEVIEFIEDGFIKNMQDIEGLKKYLVSHGVISSSAKLTIK